MNIVMLRDDLCQLHDVAFKEYKFMIVLLF